MGILIRRAAEQDYGNIVNACTAEGWTTFAQHKPAFCGVLDSSAFIVAYDEDLFAGYARAVSDGVITTYLCEILVCKEYRNRGIGKELINNIRQIFPHTRLDLVSNADGFYTAIGFKELGKGFRISNS